MGSCSEEAMSRGLVQQDLRSLTSTGNVGMKAVTQSRHARSDQQSRGEPYRINQSASRFAAVG